MNKKIIIFILVSVLLISFVTAFDFDNVQSSIDEKEDLILGENIIPYNDLWDKYNPISINNLFGLGGNLFTGAITEHTNVCIQDCNSVVALDHSGGVLIQDIRFIGNQPKSYVIQISNGLDKENWKVYNVGDELAEGYYKLKISGSINVYESTDWQIKVQGEWLESWAVWDSGLVSYYNLNEATGDAYDVKGGYDLTENGTVPSSPGKNKTGRGEFSSVNYFYSGSAYTLNENNSFSLNFWVNRTGEQASDVRFISNSNSSSGYFWHVFRFDNNEQIRVITGEVGETAQIDITSNTSIPLNTYTMVTFTYNGSTTTNTGNLYFNNSLVGTDTGGDLGGLNSPTLYIGKETGNVGLQNGTIDEVALFTKVLNTTEISEIYNSGAGDFPALGCKIEYNNTNSTIPCSDLPNVNYPGSTIDYVLNGDTLSVNYTSNGTDYIHNLTLGSQSNFTIWYENGTANYSTTTSWTNKIYASALTYSSTANEGVATNFTINMTLGTGYQLSIANLVYDGTNYGSVFNKDSQDYSIIKSLTTPSVSADSNKTFNWSFMLSDDSVINSSSYTQTVSDFGIDNCSVNNFTLYNFTLVDEETQNKITNGSSGVDLQVYSMDRTLNIQNYSKIFNETSIPTPNPFAICISNNLSNSEFRVDVQVQYGATGYSTELYHIQNEIINSSLLSQNITLYDLNSSDAQVFKLTYKDSSFIPVENAIIKVYRKYVDEGLFKVVEVPKTNADGETVAHLVVDSVIYNFVIMKNGVVLDSYYNTLAQCQTPLVSSCTINFNAYADTITVPDYSTADDFNYTLGYDNSTRIITSQFVIPSGDASEVLLQVYTSDVLRESVCSDTLTSSTGTLTCTVPNTFGNSTIIAELYKDSSLIATGSIKLDLSPSDLYGVSLVLLSLFVMMTLIGAGLSDNPIYTVIFLVVGVILLFTLNLVENSGFIGSTATILFLFIAIIIIIIKGSRRN